MEPHADAWMRRLAAIALPLVLLAAALVPRASTNAQSGVDDELAYGPETGYFFFWDPAILSLQEATSEPGTDHWRLTDGDATVDLWAYSDLAVSTA